MAKTPKTRLSEVGSPEAKVTNNKVTNCKGTNCKATKVMFRNRKGRQGSPNIKPQ